MSGIALLLCAGALTYLSRALPLWRAQSPAIARMARWLGHVGPATLAALVVQALVALPPERRLAGALALVPTAAVAWRTRSLLWTVLAGLICYGLLAARGGAA
ncbi:MAG TPA: AzlD domain-containing protein [Limnochordia bacterium]